MSRFLSHFPFPTPASFLGVVVSGNKLLQKANFYKISQTELPITALDFVITARDPTVLFFLFGYTKKAFLLFISVLYIFIISLASALFFYLKGRSALEYWHLSLVIILFVAVFSYFRQRLFEDVSQHLHQTQPFGQNTLDHMGLIMGTWEFDSFATLSKHLGAQLLFFILLV